MTRQDGFEVADTDTGLLADPKVLALARRLHDSIRTGAAIALYDAVRLASWKAGRRLTLNETVPGWWLDPVDDLGDALVAVGLLDDERRIPAGAWEGWFGAARDRRERYRVLGSHGGKAAHGLFGKGAQTPLDPTAERTVEPTVEPTQPPEHAVERTVEPDRPTVRPTDSPLPPVRRGHRNGSSRQDGTSPRATGTAPRQVRQRGEMQAVGALLRRAMETTNQPIEKAGPEPEQREGETW